MNKLVSLIFHIWKIEIMITNIRGIILWKLNEKRIKSTLILAFSKCSINVTSLPSLSLRKGLSLSAKTSWASQHWDFYILSVTKSTLPGFLSPTYAFPFLHEERISQLSEYFIIACLYCLLLLFTLYSCFLLISHKLTDKKYYLNRQVCKYKDALSTNILLLKKLWNI